MIVRVVRAWVSEGFSTEWQRLVKQHSIPWMKKQSGCIAAYPGRPLEQNGSNFSPTSVWNDVRAIQAAVGESWQEAILFGDEAKIVDRIEVRHYEIF